MYAPNPCDPPRDGRQPEYRDDQRRGTGFDVTRGPGRDVTVHVVLLVVLIRPCAR